MSAMPEPKRVLYRVVPLIEGWPEKSLGPSSSPTFTLNGPTVPRVRYGDEEGDWGADQHACHDCRVIKGEFHVAGCDGEESPECGGQLISCDCPFDESATFLS
jgi:hypothetical protein